MHAHARAPTDKTKAATNYFFSSSSVPFFHFDILFLTKFARGMRSAINSNCSFPLLPLFQEIQDINSTFTSFILLNCHSETWSYDISFQSLGEFLAVIHAKLPSTTCTTKSFKRREAIPAAACIVC